MRKKLEMLYKDWQQQVLLPINETLKARAFSNPIYMGFSEKFNFSGKTVMIVGQETYGWEGKYSDTKSISELQSVWEDYLNCQIYGVENGAKYNSSPLWRFAKKLQIKTDSNLFWNNIDKIAKHEENGKTAIPLSKEEIEMLNKKFGKEKKSLFQYEIDTVNPIAVVFLTGPSYIQSMSVALGIDEKSLLNSRPRKEKPIAKIDIPGYRLSVLWTYHPSYLNRIKKLDECVEKISNTINNLS